MHVAHQLKKENLQIKIDQQNADLDALFHVGGTFGDHSSFDFRPPRQEIFIDAHKPADLLPAIDRGNTRLAVSETTAAIDIRVSVDEMFALLAGF